MNDNDGILRRRMTPWTPRKTYFSKALVWAREHHTLPTPLSDILDYVASRGYRQILLTGGHDAAHTPEREYWMEPTTLERGGWAIERYVPDPRSCVYYRGGSTGSSNAHKERITVRMSAAWYDDCLDTALIEQAHTRLEHLLKTEFDAGAILFGTPSRTGQDLLLRSLPQYDDFDERGRRTKQPYEYLPAPADVRDILTHNFGQGRMEFVAPPQRRAVSSPPLREMFLLDARWMYAAHVRGLPVLLAGSPSSAQVVHDTAPDFEAYRPGFYRVLFRAPQDWGHIGLLPVWDAEELRTTWPVESFFWQTGWATEPEVRLALREGWDVRVRERILFAPSSTPGSDPARTWIETLIRLRARIAGNNTSNSNSNSTDPTENTQSADRLLSAALRNLVITPVGAWTRRDKRELHVTLPGHEGEIPDDAEDVTPIYADPTKPTPDTLVRIEWYSLGRLDAMQAAMYRPEWSVAVWGSARRTLAEESLRYPQDGQIALRSDALALRYLPTNLREDDGKPGRFRLKKVWHFDTPQAIPQDESSWRALTGGEE